MEVAARFRDHATILAVSESVPQAQTRDFGVTDASLKFFNNFVKQVTATARMARMKQTPTSTAQRKVRRSSRIDNPLAASLSTPDAAAVTALVVQPPAKVYSSPSIVISCI